MKMTATSYLADLMFPDILHFLTTDSLNYFDIIVHLISFSGENREHVLIKGK